MKCVSFEQAQNKINIPEIPERNVSFYLKMQIFARETACRKYGTVWLAFGPSNCQNFNDQIIINCVSFFISSYSARE